MKDLPQPPDLTFEQRLIAFDAALAAVRRTFRAWGLKEVITPARIDAVAIEPFIEPIAASDRWLQTSPELAMKRLLCRGSGSIFQIAPVWRRGEVGPQHREEFHLVEWYRVGVGLEDVRLDVERLVGEVIDAVQSALGQRTTITDTMKWETWSFCELVKRTCGVELHGQESADELRQAVVSHRSDLWVEPPGPGIRSEGGQALAAWTAWFSHWSDLVLDPWLKRRSLSCVHLIEFPIALSALSKVSNVTTSTGVRSVAHRFESYVLGRELANGYLELRDRAEQHRRFDLVQELRLALDQPLLPIPEAFLIELETRGLPLCSGAAIGFERLLMVACGAKTIADVALASFM